jgi:hypothetical protein
MQALGRFTMKCRSDWTKVQYRPRNAVTKLNQLACAGVKIRREAVRVNVPRTNYVGSTEMKVGNLLFAAAAAMVMHVAFAQPQTTVDVTKAPGQAKVTATATVTATVVGIAPETRTVTLKDRKGKVFEVEVGEDARNFDQLKVGDLVTMEYRQAISLSLEKTSGPRSATQQLIEQRSAPGAKPGGTVGREVTVMADVVAINTKTKAVSLKGPQGNTVDVIVEDPEQLKNIRKGDQVKVVYTEAVAISVTPGASQ